jgi:hypothetical protein
MDGQATTTIAGAPLAQMQAQAPTTPPPVVVEAQAVPPTQAPPTQAPPVVEAKPKAKPAAKPKPSADTTQQASIARLAALEEKLSAQATRAELYADRLDAQMLRQKQTALLDTLRPSAVEGYTDAQLLALAPDVDVSTTEGRASLENWRASNQHLFKSSGVRPLPTAADMLEAMPMKQSRNGVFKSDLLAKMLDDNLGRSQR